MKLFNPMLNVGKVKYLVNFHDGIKKHKDGSMFFDIRTFKNKKEFEKFQKELKRDGYFYGDSSFKITKDNIHLYYEFMGDIELEREYHTVSKLFTYDRLENIANSLNVPTDTISTRKALRRTYGDKCLFLGFNAFGVKDTLKPIDEYIEEIKSSGEYLSYMASK